MPAGSAGPGKPFVPWDTPNYALSQDKQVKDLAQLQQLANEERNRPASKSMDDDDDESSQAASPVPTGSPSLALMVELALQEALTIASMYEGRGLRLNEKHRRLLVALGKLGE